MILIEKKRLLMYNLIKLIKEVIMQTIGVLTSGGDAPGMNAAIRGVVRYANSVNMTVYGVERGYNGLINGEIKRLDSRSVSDIIHRGGTVLKTARCPEFVTDAGMKKAHDVLKAFGIQGLVVIGGDGSYRGIKDLRDKFNFPCIGIPGTIDNDLMYTDFTLGFDSAVNTVVNAINNIRDTMTSHERACIIEVMGRKCGDIAIYAGLAGGAELIIVPELEYSLDEVCNVINANKLKGKTSDIIILAEGVCDAEELKAKMRDHVDVSLKTVKLGYIQRGGTPTMADRVLGARCAVRAVDLLKNDIGFRCVGIKNNQIIDMDITEALSLPRVFNEDLYRVANILGK